MVSQSEARSQASRSKAQLLSGERIRATFCVAQEGLDLSRGSARLVSMVLPLLHGPSLPRRRTADQTLARDTPSHRTNQEKLSAARTRMSTQATAGITALGLRFTKNLNRRNNRQALVSKFCGLMIERRETQRCFPILFQEYFTSP